MKNVLKKLNLDIHILSKAEGVREKIAESIKKQGYKAEAVIGGSVAKGTYLEDPDCDIFVKFDMMYKGKDISQMLEKILYGFKDKERVHGSRDYFRMNIEGQVYEIVPVLDIKDSSEAVNVTDVSPLHADWVKANLKGLRDDVRLAKLFCKANDVYGAESYINAFSGYILEILVIYYGGFMKMMKAVSRWKPKNVIDISGFYSKKDVFKEMNISKTISPVIVVDPVQKERNAAAAVSYEKFCDLIYAAKKFLKEQDESAFVKRKFSMKDIEKRAKKYDTSLIALKAKAIEGKQDIAGAKLLKVFMFVKTQIMLNEFNVFDSGWNWENGKEAVMWYMIYPKKLPKYQRKTGPLIYSEKAHVEKFMAKYDEFIVDSGRLYAAAKRKFTDPEKFMKKLIKDEWFKDKVKGVRVWH